ncbi:unnamed protein product [Ostreobium quekettii]|uniref:Amidase domain-containing protein n=1 Tax=Ostreobium quekettii TaxID=121088 RepID=A0A8S1J2Z5_9CHLO|nr:unnamed protein product [Ostreobium quekettii]|eukprot:evm.model.scf_86.3 EVM.evm.TU.scf_86.3   scf_86:25235-29581(+)
MRPCVGRVPCCQDPAARNTSPEEARLVSVNGPMGRCVEDVALLLDAMAKPHPKDPWSREPPRQSFLEALQKEPLQLPSSIAWSPDLGVCPVQPGVAEICKRAADWFRESLGCQVVEDCPDFSQAQRAFQVLRAAMFRSLGFMLKGPSKDVIKPDLVWQIQKGVDLSDEEVSEAELQHSSIMESVTSFFQEYDLLACPCALLPPFDVRTRWVRQVEGAAFDNYIDWLMPTYIISLTKLPALSLPCGMTKEGTPVGIQLVGPPNGEAGVLAAALAYERAHPFAGMLPIDPI